MARETKTERAARVAADNEFALDLPTGAAYEDPIFGTVTLGENLGPTEDSDGWDIWTVKHSGVTLHWASGSVAAAFGAKR